MVHLEKTELPYDPANPGHGQADCLVTDFPPTDEPHSSDKGLQYIAHPYFEPTGQRNVVEDHAAVTTEDGRTRAGNDRDDEG